MLEGGRAVESATTGTSIQQDSQQQDRRMQEEHSSQLQPPLPEAFAAHSAHEPLLTWQPEDERAPPFNHPLAMACASGHYRFLCAASSGACVRRAASLPARERSGFLRAFVHRATAEMQPLTAAAAASPLDARAELHNRSRDVAVDVAERLAAMWATPCLVVRTSHCPHARKATPTFSARTWRGRRTKRELSSV